MRKTHDPTLSIIVPIYKVETYLSRCINSILSQNFTDFELLLIDDGSLDRCGEIMEQFASQDKRVITIHQRNGGVSAARNAGLEIARGTYIGFVDPDDWIEPEMYEKMIRVMETENADIICCNWNDVQPDGEINGNSFAGIPVRMEHNEFINHIFDIPYSILGVVWNKLFKRELIASRFPVGCSMGEDTLFSICYALSVRSAICLDSRYYNFFLREDSAMRERPEKMAEGLAIWEQAMDLVKEETEDTKFLAQRMYLDKCLLFSKIEGEVGRNAKTCFRAYFNKNIFSVLRNRKIPWTTRIYFTRYYFS